MQKFLNKSLTKKIILILVIAILCGFTMPNYSHADWGVLVDPLKSLLAVLGDGVMGLVNVCFTGVWIGLPDGSMAEVTKEQENDWAESWSVIDWPTIIVTPEEIFSNKVVGLRANFLKPEATGESTEDNGLTWGQSFTESVRAGYISRGIGAKMYGTMMGKLRKVIAGWYVTIRNIAAAGLFCVLIYIGIRVLISSISEERAKYKSMLINWVVAICLVFILHYIMAAIMFITEKTVEVIGDAAGPGSYEVKSPGKEGAESFKLKHVAKVGGGKTDAYVDSETAVVHNIVELVRVYVSLENRGMAFGYLFVYYVLIFYTIKFIFRYLKRFMYMAFLTMIAPMIAFTYPIDKVKDGTAQAFNKWFVEYLFNALLQPIHMLLYATLVGAAVDLVQVNIVYAIVALAFIDKAEKLVKDIFGLNKASTPPSPAGSMLAANVIQKGYERLRGGSGNSGNASAKSGNSGGSGGSPNSKVRQSRGLEAYNNSSGSNSGTQGVTGGRSTRTNAVGTGTGGSSTSVDSSQQGFNSMGGTSTAIPATVEPPRSSETQNPPQNNSSSENGTQQAQAVQPSGQRRKISKPKALLKAGAKAIGRTGVRAAKFTGKKLGRGAIRTVAFAAAAVPTLAAGALAYAVSGNAKYLGMGVGVAHALSGRAADKISRAPRAIRAAYRRETLGEKGAAAQENLDNFLKDKDNLRYLREHNSNFNNLSDRDIKEKLKNSDASNFIKAGYTNAEDVNNLMNMQSSMREANMTQEQLMAAYDMSSGIKSELLMDEEKSLQMEDNLAKEIQARSEVPMDAELAQEKAHNHMNAMRVARGLSKTDREKGNNRVSRAERKAAEEAEQQRVREKEQEVARQQAEEQRKRAETVQNEQLDLLRQIATNGQNSRENRNRTAGTHRRNSRQGGSSGNTSSSTGGRTGGSHRRNPRK